MKNTTDRFEWERVARESPEVTGDRLCFLLLLATHWDRKTGRVQVGHSTLARELGRSVKTSNRWMSWAREAGWVEQVTAGRHNVGASEYLLTVPEQQDTQSVPLKEVSAGHSECRPEPSDSGTAEDLQWDSSGLSVGHLGVAHSEVHNNLSEKEAAGALTFERVEALRNYARSKGLPQYGYGENACRDVERILREKVPDVNMLGVMISFVNGGITAPARFARTLSAEEIRDRSRESVPPGGSHLNGLQQYDSRFVI